MELNKDSKQFITSVAKMYLNSEPGIKLNVKVSTDGRRHMMKGEKVLNVTVSNEEEKQQLITFCNEYIADKQASKEISDHSTLESSAKTNTEPDYFDDILKIFAEPYPNPNRLKELTSRDPKSESRKPVNKRNPKRKTQDQRTISNKPRKSAGKKRYTGKHKSISKTLGAIVMSSLLLSSTVATSNARQNYKTEAASSALTTLKETLDADEVYDYSSVTGSNTATVHYEVKKDGKTYSYIARVNDGKTTVLKDDGINENTRSAIQTVAHAQGGNIFDAMNANRLTKKINKGELNLTVGENTSQKEVDNDFER